MRCGDCKFWGKQVRERYGNGPVDQTGEWRQCGRVFHDDDSSCWGSDEFVRENYSEESARRIIADPKRKELAVVADGSDYFAALKCREDFGCVLFEPTECP